MPIDPGPTRQRLIDAGLELFAVQGVAATSMAQVIRAAGQRNARALQYHFGDVDGLLRAMLEPHADAIRRRRTELLAASVARSGRKSPLRDGVEVLVRPFAELATGDRPARCAVRVIADVFTDPARGLRDVDDLIGERSVEEMGTLLWSGLSHLPRAIRTERLTTVARLALHASSDRARRAEHVSSGRQMLPAAKFVDNLIDMFTAALDAPISTR